MKTHLVYLIKIKQTQNYELSSYSNINMGKNINQTSYVITRSSMYQGKTVYTIKETR